MIIDIQLNTAKSTWSELRDQAQACEAHGFGGIWVWDHLSGATMGGGHTMSDCFTLLGALAVVTTSIHIGPMVANVQNRHAALLANAAATLQNIADGRLLLGLGSGGGPTSPFTAEHRNANVALLPTLAQRHELLAHNLDTMDALWADDRADTYAGFPRPVVTPPRIVGVNSEPLARLAGRRAEGVNVRGQSDNVRELLEAARSEAGSRPFISTGWLPFDDEHLDPSHPLRERVGDLDRLIFVAFQPTDPRAIAAAAKRLGTST